MRFLVFSDLHLDAVTAGMRRIDDLHQGLVQVANIAVERGADVVACLGDISDPDAGSILVRAYDSLFGFVTSMQAADKHVIFVAGNHDVIEDGSGATTIRPLRHVGVNVAEQPRTFASGEVDIICLPYASRATMYDPDRYVSSYRRSPGARAAVVLGHMTGLDGVQVGSESRDFARGSSMPFPVEACRKIGVSYMCNGHYHRAQTTPDGVHVPGSLARLRFDEETNLPGVLVFDV